MKKQLSFIIVLALGMLMLSQCDCTPSQHQHTESKNYTFWSNDSCVCDSGYSSNNGYDGCYDANSIFITSTFQSGTSIIITLDSSWGAATSTASQAQARITVTEGGFTGRSISYTATKTSDYQFSLDSFSPSLQTGETYYISISEGAFYNSTSSNTAAVFTIKW